MPSLEHQVLVDLLRTQPTFALELLKIEHDLQLPPFSRIDPINPEIEQMLPVEFHADLLLALRHHSEKLAAELIVEIQLKTDARKKFTWPLYYVSELYKCRCPVLLLVVTVDTHVCEWASKPLQFDFMHGHFRPHVIGPRNIPRIKDEALALEHWPLAILSALAFAKDENEGADIAWCALQALDKTPMDESVHQAYYWTVWSALSPVLQKALEPRIMSEHAFKNVPVAPPLQWRAEYFRSEGRTEGRAEGARHLLLRTIERKNIRLSEEQKSRIAQCQDVNLLELWHDRAVDGLSAQAIFE